MCVVGLVACKEASNAGPPSGREAGAGSEGPGSSGGETSVVDPEERPYRVSFSSVSDPNSPTTGGTSPSGGSGGTTSNAVVPPFGTSTNCGDAIVGLDEECDDGNDDDSDACTTHCQTHDQAVAAADADVEHHLLPDRYLGSGRHPVAGLNDGFISSYVEIDALEQEPEVFATLYDIWGTPKFRGSVSAGAHPVDEANPVAVALPDGKCAVAWTDFDGDGSDLGIALRAVGATGELGSLFSANAGREFSQLNPDMIWTGSQLVVAWEDYADASTGPDLRYRLFDADLRALSGDLSLASTDAPEAAVALAPFGASFAAAYREGTPEGLENVVVKVGSATYRVGPVAGGPMSDRPALVGLDATHVLVAFSADPSMSATTGVSRVQYSVIDTASGAASAIRSLDALNEAMSLDGQGTQTSPSVVPAPGGAYLAWRSEAAPGDAAGDQLWLRRLRWSGTGSAARLSTDEPELLLPRACDSSIGDQRAPALAMTGLPPSGGLVATWEDYGRSFGVGAGEPEVAVQYAPLRVSDMVAAPLSLSETWTAPTGSPWPSRWSSTAAPPVTLSSQFQVGELLAYSLPGSAFAWPNDHTARDVDLTTTLRFGNASQQIGLFARRADDQPNFYVGATINTKKADTWRLYSITPDAAGQPVTTVLKSIPIPTGSWLNAVGMLMNFRLRFRVQTLADGSVFMGMKWWRLGAPEPTSWSLQTTEPPTSVVATQLGNRAGRFGLMGSAPTANGGRLSFDDFSVKFFEGTGTGNLDAVSNSPPLLLPRSTAQYRQCRPGQPCAVADGCCAGSADCLAGLVCDASSGEAYGVGSHAATCVAGHCANAVLDAGEDHADCGGSDCQACNCSGVAKGEAGYCSEMCPGGIGDYPCSRNAECLPGLVCGTEAGEPFGSTAGANACVPPHCMNRLLDGNETAIDCGGDCGSNCNVCDAANGTYGHCRTYCQCPAGEGNCRNDDDCAAPNVCAAQAANYGISTSFFVCTPPHCLNGVKEAVLGETSIDFGGECSKSIGLSLASFPPLLYRKVRYAIETGDHIVLPTTGTLAGNLTTPVLKGYNRFILNVAATANVSITLNVGNSGLSANPAVTVKAFNGNGTTLRTAVMPSSNGSTVSTSMLIGRLGAGNYEVDVTPADDGLTYSLTRDASVTLALRDGADLRGPVAAPLYFYVPAEVSWAFIYADFDAATPVEIRDPNNNVVTPLAVTSQIYGLETNGKPGVWSASFKTTMPRAHLVNLPDIFSFHRDAVITSKIIRTGLDYGLPPSLATTTQYLRYDNRFVFHVSSPTAPNVFTFTLESTTAPPPFEVRLQKLDGTHVGASPYTPAVGDTVMDAGLLPVGDYEFWVVNPSTTPRYKITVPAGVTFAAVDGFNVGNVWLASYRDYFYVPSGVGTVRFGAPVPATIYKVYDPLGALVAGQPPAGTNNVYAIATPTNGTWSMNIQGATNIRFLNIPQVIGLTPGITAVPLPSAPFTCTSSATCGAGEVCGTDNGARFGKPPTDDYCWAATCATAPAGSCGSVLHPCGTCPP